MSPRLDGVLGLTLVAAQAVAAASILTLSPTGPVAMHFDMLGEVNRWGSRGEAATIVGAMGLLSLGSVAIARGRRDSPAENRSVTASLMVVLLVTSLITMLFWALAFHLVQPGLGIFTLMMAGISAVFAIVGSFLGKIGPNRWVGIRTPWTRSSRLAWDKTHRLGGRLFFWCGLVGLAAVPLSPQPYGLQAMVIGILTISAITVFESWRIWRSDPARTAF